MSQGNASSAPENLTKILDRIEARVDEGGGSKKPGQFSLGDILDVVGRRAYGPMLLIVGLLSVSPLALIPGSTWVMAALTLVIATQMAFNLKHPWLPKSALNLSFSRSRMSGALKKIRPWTRAVDKVVKPRLQFLAREPWLLLISLLVIAAALITFPLGFIPLAPFIPGVAVILVGLGVTARDGLLLGIALVVMGAAGFLLATRFL